MPLLNILLRDNCNKICQKMLSLKEETELLICNNINAINKKNGTANLKINTIDFNFSTNELVNEGWRFDDGLYDRLIIQYNQDPDTDKLKRWQ